MKLLISAVSALILAIIVSGKDHIDDGRRVNGNDDWRKDEFKRTSKRVSLSMDPVVGHFNLTGKDGELCLRMVGGIRLEITYEKKNGSTGMTTIVSDNDTVVSNIESHCWNGSTDFNENLGLRLGQDRLLVLDFTRDHNVTGDNKEQKWQLYRIEFKFLFDSDFPDAKQSGQFMIMSSSQPLKEVASTMGRSYGCSKLEPIQVIDQLKVTFTDLRVQPFMSAGSEDFSAADWCANEQTSDLIPIIIGAALAALVIIVLIAYLIGRARAKSTSYDNI